jgi:hypothetical protein
VNGEKTPSRRPGWRRGGTLAATVLASACTSASLPPATPPAPKIDMKTSDPGPEPHWGPVVETTRRTSGYVPPVLTSVWARAPYGHAGQWPNLRFLATKPSLRPTRFVVHGNAPLDLAKVGLTTSEPEAPLGPGDYLQDGTKDGFRVSGHPFLADLGDDSTAVVEYLKTL